MGIYGTLLVIKDLLCLDSAEYSRARSTYDNETLKQFHDRRLCTCENDSMDC